MQCFQQLLLLVLLLPIPSASPLFVLLFGIAVFWSIGPCVYCIALCSIIFLSTSPSSPLTTRPPPHLAPNTSFPLTSPLPERFWIHLNHGRWADPGLVGYWEMSKVSESAGGRGSNAESEVVSGAESALASGNEHPKDGHGSGEGVLGQESSRDDNGEVSDAERDPKSSENGLMASALRRVFRSFIRSISPPWIDSNHARAYHTDRTPPTSGGYRPPETESRTYPDGDVELPPSSSTGIPSPVPPVPRQYLDLRFKGLGLVLDLGWRRSEEGLRWELDDWREAARREKRGQGTGGALWGSAHLSGGQDTSDDAEGAEAGKVNRVGKLGRWLWKIVGREGVRNGGEGVETNTGTGTGTDGKRKGGERSGFWATTPFVGAW